MARNVVLCLGAVPKSHYHSNKVLNEALRSGPRYMALYTAAPSPEGGGTEVVGGGYVRAQIVFTEPVNGICSNAIDTQFPDSNDSWGLLGHFGIFDSVSGGNLLYFDRLPVERSINAGEHFVFQAGQLVVNEF